jgi:hypothetical protein
MIMTACILIALLTHAFVLLYCSNKGWRKTTIFLRITFYGVAAFAYYLLFWTPEIPEDIRKFLAQNPAKIAATVFSWQLKVIILLVGFNMIRAAFEIHRGESEAVFRRILYKVLAVVVLVGILSNTVGDLFEGLLRQARFADISEIYIPSLCFIPIALYLSPICRLARVISLALLTILIFCVLHLAAIGAWRDLVGAINYVVSGIIVFAVMTVLIYMARAAIGAVWHVKNSTIQEFATKFERVAISTFYAAIDAATAEFKKQFQPGDNSAKAILHKTPDE